MTAKELAQKLGVSQAAVSLAFNGRTGISDETRRRILEAAEQYDVRRPQRKAPPSSTIDVICYKKHGLVFGETPFFAALMEGIASSASAAGYAVRISYIYGDGIAPLETIRANDGVGMVIIATEMTEDSEIEAFLGLNRPMVIVDAPFRYRNYPSVLISNAQGAFEATSCLLRHGHRFIGHLRSSVHIFNFYEREEGFHAACQAYPDCRTITVDVGSTQETAFADMLAWLKTNPTMPTCFFADNDLIALSCVRALKDMHYRVPQDISIVGFDDIPISAVSSPALTTVHVPKEEMGGAAVDLLETLMQNPDHPPFSIRISTSLVERRSVSDLTL